MADLPGTTRASLKVRATRVTARLVVAQAVVVFAAAGTLGFWQGWAYCGLQLTSMTAINAYLLRHDPALMERRLVIVESSETGRLQRVVIAVMRLVGLAMLVVAGLDHRFGWSSVPPAIVAAGCIVSTAGAALIFRVFRENTYTSSVIEVGAEQTVVATGPYRRVRHPMYAGTLLIGLATPLVLGSYVAELCLPPSFALLVMRILAEERFLSARLIGYDAYLRVTRWRLIPGVW
jgi:protein-S-isoprenylcysteine O-methyltransferase Ste14